MRALRGSNAAAVIARLNPIIRGWAAYYRTVVSREIFNSLDHYLWKLVYKWARHTHPNKPTSWVVARYFGMFNKSRRDRWVFGDRDSGAYLQRFAWTRIVRHQLVTGTASPDDPVLADYWTSRRRRPRLQPPVDRTTQQLLDSQRADASTAGNSSCTPTARHKPHASGNSGIAACAKRWTTTPSAYDRTAARTIRNSVCSTHTATAGPPAKRQTSTSARQRRHRACLSRMHGNVHVRF